MDNGQLLDTLKDHSKNYIFVKWVPEETYGKAMRVIKSNHPRFGEGTRFDFGFFSIATDEGYTVISLPL